MTNASVAPSAHFIAIGGAVMHNLALALQAKGWKVTGSDDDIQEPSRGRLEAHGLLPDEMGWHPERITPDLTAVVVGMHAAADNPELLRAQQLGLKVYSFPDFLYEQMKEKRRIVVCGSHGKTTTTAMIMHALRCAGRRFDYMVGSQVQGFDLMVGFDNSAELAVLEGDEYLTSPLDPTSKFLHYHPNIAIITGAEWDHINVFPTYEQYLGAFRALVASVEPGGSIFYCAEDEHLRDLPTWPRAAGVTVKPYRGLPWRVNPGDFVLADFGGKELPLHIFGDHNMLNMSAALEVCRLVGLSETEFADAMSCFQGAARRLQAIAHGPAGTAYLDFAHSPSKLKATIAAVRKRHPNGKLTVLFELHTLSSLRKEFLAHYAHTMDQADVALVFWDSAEVQRRKLKYFSAHDVIEAFAPTNKQHIRVGNEMSPLWHEVCDVKRSPDNVFLFCSSGNFKGEDIQQLAYLCTCDPGALKELYFAHQWPEDTYWGSQGCGF